MPVGRLTPTQLARLSDVAFTYEPVGATATRHPPGYSSFARTVALDRGLDEAAHDLLAWQVQTRAGVGVAASSMTVVPDAVVLLRLGLGRLAVSAPCRVVYVLEAPDVRGFAYGTLPGHPECGEEAFVLRRRPDGRVEFTVSAFSRPATRLARLGGPLTPAVQRLVTARYLRALG